MWCGFLRCRPSKVVCFSYSGSSVRVTQMLILQRPCSDRMLYLVHQLKSYQILYKYLTTLEYPLKIELTATEQPSDSSVCHNTSRAKARLLNGVLALSFYVCAQLNVHISTSSQYMYYYYKTLNYYQYSHNTSRAKARVLNGVLASLALCMCTATCTLLRGVYTGALASTSTVGPYCYFSSSYYRLRTYCTFACTVHLIESLRIHTA